MGTSAYQGDSPVELVEKEDGAFSLSELWLAILNNKWLVLFSVVVAIGAAVAYTRTRIPLYSASATIRMDPEAPQPLGEKVDHVADIEGDYWNRQEYYNTVFETIRAKSTALLVVKEQSLHHNYGFVTGTANDEHSPEALVSPEEAASILQWRLGINGVKDSRLANVSFTDANPERAARILQGILDAYIRTHLAEMNQAGEDAANWLGGQLTQLQGRLEKSERALHDYKKDKQILSVSADDQSEMLRQKMSHLTGSLTEAEATLAKIGARRAELRKIEGDDPTQLPAHELTQSLVLKSLREKYILATEQVESLEAEGKGAGHPAMASAVARRKAAKKLLLAEVANIKESVEKDYSAAQREIGSLRSLYASAKEQALKLNLLAIEYKRLERARDTDQQLVSLVTERSEETGLTKNLRPSNVRIVDHPEIPLAPYFPNHTLNLLGGALGGLLLGLGLAIGREQLDSSLRRPEMLEKVLGMPFLGILPLVRRGRSQRRSRGKKGIAPPQAESNLELRSELAVHYDHSGAIAEAARALRTNVLLGRDVSENTKLILMTSAAPGDGKTTVACSLAISLAQTGQKVALVDCDLRRPRSHRIFGKTNEAGISTVLAGAMTLDEIKQSTMVDNLTVITSGAPPVNPAELLHSEGFAQLLRDLRKDFDRVVIDSPPLIPVADAAILATQTDATVVVARAFETKKHTARRAARVLNDVNANVIGTVLNAVDFERGEYRYYQYYDYHSAPKPSNFPASKN